MCDRAFPDRDGWFGEFYAESRTWIATPPWFRSWVEHEQHAATLRMSIGGQYGETLTGTYFTDRLTRGELTFNQWSRASFGDAASALASAEFGTAHPFA